MIRSISFQGREECLSKGVKELKKAKPVKVFGEYEPTGLIQKAKPSIAGEVVAADTEAVKAKYFSPFQCAVKPEKPVEEIVVEEGKFFG